MFRRLIMAIFLTDTRSRAHFTPSLSHVNSPCMFCITAYQAPKHVAVPYVENTLYSTNKYSCVRPVHTLYISYWFLLVVGLPWTSRHRLGFPRARVLTDSLYKLSVFAEGSKLGGDVVDSIGVSEIRALKGI